MVMIVQDLDTSMVMITMIVNRMVLILVMSMVLGVIIIMVTVMIMFMIPDYCYCCDYGY